MSFVILDDANGLSYLPLGDIHRYPPLVFLHGIMGNKKNLKGFVEKFLDQCPNNSAIIFDLRNHGLSSKHWAPYTVAACAKDIGYACLRLDLKPKAIIGHSYGGKVALLAAETIASIEQVWLLDCPPGPIVKWQPLHDVASPTALDTIEILISLSWPVLSRKSLVDQMVSKGVNPHIAAWMTTNLVETKDGLRLVFEPAELLEMLLTFIDLDLWSLISVLSKRMHIHLVAAEYGQRVTREDEEKLLKYAKIGCGFFHHLEHAGHFLHVDNPNGLIDILKKYVHPTD